MKHNPIVIEQSDLYHRIINDNCGFEPEYAQDVCVNSGYYLVKWPEHVTVPKFNGDCSISYVGRTLEIGLNQYPEIANYRLYSGFGESVGDRILECRNRFLPIGVQPATTL